jgi:carboxyl-terminal processing protease
VKLRHRVALALLALLPASMPGGAQNAVATRTPPAAAAAVLQDLMPLPAHAAVGRSVADQLTRHHYVRRQLDDAVSSHTFDNYLEFLDGQRSYFMAADIAEFEPWRHRLDDALRDGDLKPAFTMFNRFQARRKERIEHQLELLAAGLEKLDFTRNESLEVDRAEAPWPRDRAELDDLGRRILKATVLGYRLRSDPKPLPEIQELLTKRLRNQLSRAGQTTPEDAFQLFINAFAATYDPHTQYLSPRTYENFNINMSLQLEGIGAVLRTDDDYTAVVSLVTAGPADKAGTLHPGDRIVGVGQAETPVVDVVGWRLDDVVELIRGPRDTVVRLEVLPAKSETPRTVEIRRDTVKLEEQAAQKRIIDVTDAAGQQRRIGVIEVPTFYADFQAAQMGKSDYTSTTRDVARLIDELEGEGIHGLIVDLRNNSGGALEEANTLTGLFIESGPTVQIKAQGDRRNILRDVDSSIAWEGPMAVLVNRLSASASEIFAGAIQDYGRGLVLGARTFGKGTVQSLVRLEQGQLKITQAKFYRVSGVSTQHVGVEPDILFPDRIDPEIVGESALDDALAGDRIDAAPYRRLLSMDTFLGDLVERHDARTARDPEFVYLRALAAKDAELRARKVVSLNEAARLREKQADDAWRLRVENDLRKAQGKPLLASLDELDDGDDAGEDADPDALPADAGEAAAAGADAHAKGDEPDATLREAGQVLSDFITTVRPVAVTTAGAAVRQQPPAN